MEDVNKQIFFLFLNLDKALRDSTPCEFLYILRSKLFGIIATKFEKPRIPFLNDVFATVAVLAS